jgi:hypothetical protein
MTEIEILDIDQFAWGTSARTTDPDTSKAAASSQKNNLRWGSQRHRLLQLFYELGEMTDEEAGKASGLYDARACYWKRCGELRDFGLIADTGRTRISGCGNEVLTSTITEEGVSRLKEMEGQGNE